MNDLKFIPVGPIDGFYHVAYQIPGTKVWSSVCMCRTEKEALNECEFYEFGGETFNPEDVITSTKE